MSRNLAGRVDRLEKHLPVSGTRTKRTVPAQSFDYATFERRFWEMRETAPGFLDLWLQERDRHAAE